MSQQAIKKSLRQMVRRIIEQVLARTDTAGMCGSKIVFLNEYPWFYLDPCPFCQQHKEGNLFPPGLDSCDFCHTSLPIRRAERQRIEEALEKE